MSKNPEELYKEREQRWNDAVAIKEPDRIPLAPFTIFWPCRYKGMSFKEAMFNLSGAAAAYKETVLEFNWDLAPSMFSLFSGNLFKYSKLKLFRVPGLDLPDEVPFQYIEGEYMKADEYKEFLANPADFIIRKYLPRVFGIFEFLKTLPEISSFMGLGGVLTIPMTAVSPDFAQAMEDLRKAGEALIQWMGVQMSYETEMKSLGYPIQANAVAMAPFDVISDFLRGMRGSMLDMYRNPEELKHAVKLVEPYQAEAAVSMARMTGNPRVFIPLHRGAGGFMSNVQFEEFYWPSLKKLILDLINAGLQPMPVFEGDYTPRLEYLKELPKGKIVACIDKTDIFKAKEEIGDRICLRGNNVRKIWILRGFSAI
ncbi:MAG: hypothetical protein KIH08_12640 [Candidatus Freyarchaeota archaeon]|nr:hypothetical protein [Candidatus Jordarchaeia archaeon]MBS7280237.1 hypothetical protein [Candidatus Jordarchaeia archaeon]